MSNNATLWKIYGSSMRFDKFFANHRTIYNADQFHPTAGDAALLQGGEDIWPGLYNETAIAECRATEITQRDIVEYKVLEAALEHNIPTIGICRGAQMLCVFSGGTLFQHVDNHRSASHALQTTDNQEIPAVPGDHHQMMRLVSPGQGVWHPLAWTPTRLSTKVLVGPEAAPVESWEEDWELEVVWFPTIRGLAIQPHPEWGTNDPKFNHFQTYVNKLVEHYILQ